MLEAREKEFAANVILRTPNEYNLKQAGQYYPEQIHWEIKCIDHAHSLIRDVAPPESNITVCHRSVVGRVAQRFPQTR